MMEQQGTGNGEQGTVEDDLGQIFAHSFELMRAYRGRSFPVVEATLPAPRKSAEQFAEEYAARSGVTVEWLRDAGRIVKPCDCADEICEGWRMGDQDAGFTFHLGPMCDRCGAELGEIHSSPHRVLCKDCSVEMERALQVRSGGVLPVVIRTNFSEIEYCGACGMKLAKYRPNFCYDCGEKVARWSHATHDIIVIDGWDYEEKVKMAESGDWRGRVDLRAYHPVRLKDSGWEA